MKYSKSSSDAKKQARLVRPPMEWYYEGGVLKSKPISGSRTASISGSINKAAVIRDFVNSKY